MGRALPSGRRRSRPETRALVRVIDRSDPFIPEDQGIYVIHAYLFDDTRRIGHERDYLSIAV